MSGEFLVNTYTGQSQESPDITRLNDGSFIVVWDSLYIEDDNLFTYAAAQKFSASGAKIGEEFIVDDDLIVEQRAEGESTRPTVTALKDGGFAVAWENSPDGNRSQEDIYTRVFNADGTPRGDIVRVPGPNPGDQQAPEISATKNGYFVTYTSYDGPKTSQQENVYLQRFDNDGVRIGEAVRINQSTKFDQQSAQATELSNGDTVVIWDSELGGKKIPGPAGHEDGVKGRIIGENGKPIGKEFTISDSNDAVSSAIEQDTSIDVAALAKGRFVASWYETVLHKNADATFEIHARVFDKDGDNVGKEIVVRAGDDGVPRHSSVIGLDDGRFVVAWDEPGDNNEFQETYARIYDKSGDAVGKAFKLNPESGQSDQEFPELAPFMKHGFFAVYESEFLDGDDDAIAGRIFEFGGKKADVAEAEGSSLYRAFAGDDRIDGLGGADSLLGGLGADHLTGGVGRDVLIGGGSSDALSGGQGRDVFVFRHASDSSMAAADHIRGFDAGEDRIDLSGIDASLDRAGDQAFRYVGGREFSGKAAELRFDGTHLCADLDGDGRADLSIEVEGVSKDALIL